LSERVISESIRHSRTENQQYYSTYPQEKRANERTKWASIFRVIEIECGSKRASTRVYVVELQKNLDKIQSYLLT